ncbi:GGDEF domain-containing protein [Curvibacter sp. CHRR-16]|uniref:putative bifunctional diguanylate cyclase/phosphodiesterase n=1 Tax=Curvibacter sp. CHRR-16 TaxID=2835872 RepID=UPI001BDB617E|nr:bifunctional diguanylate cyclase/phosphodiesterase [Curvibacter sp. CHRR-16]MBT0569557.1 GGDEF domain-containing protein [Curvibacter sp. CHRR-16]
MSELGSLGFLAIACACTGLLWVLWRWYAVPMGTLAYVDDITGYANRRLLLRHLKKRRHQWRKAPGFCAVMVVDLDNFKQVRPAQGYAWGGRLLQQVAHRMQSVLQSGDFLAREDGDCFVVVPQARWSDHGQASQAMWQQANQLQDVLRTPFVLDGQEIYLSACIGITVVDAQADASIDVLMQALAALSQAKAQGRNKVCFFDEQERQSLQNKVGLQTDLRHVLERQQLQLYFQPQVNIAGHVMGAEVLLRWTHPERGMVPPLDFISLAEESGFILRLGQWVLDQSCAQLKAWDAHPVLGGLQLSVNVSARQFLQPGFVDMVRSCVEKHQIVPNSLMLELTESVMLEYGDEVIKTMHGLRTLGVGLSLDDFGTGYSSFTHLSRLPLNQIKVDKMFMHGVEQGGHNSVIVQTLIHMAHNLGLEVVAEGVETTLQRDYLHGKQCSLYQGYLFSKPVSLEAFEALVLAQTPHNESVAL